MMKAKMKTQVVFASILVAAMMLISAIGLSAVAGVGETTTILIDVNSQSQIEQLEDNGELLIDYGNGKALLEIPKTKVNNYKLNYDMSPNENRYKIYLDSEGKIIDRRNGLPEEPKGFQDGNGVYIVQFIGPVKSNEWLKKVEDCGASIEREMANYALLVRMDETEKIKVESLDIVDWIGDYKSGYKVDPSLYGQEGNLDILVTGWKRVDRVSLKDKLNQAGATLGRTTGTGIIATIDDTLLSEIASWKEVKTIDHYRPVKPYDNVANEIHHVQEGWYTDRSGLPAQLTGAGEIIGIQDTGFDEGERYNGDDGNPDFFDGPTGDRVVRYTDQGGGSDPDGLNAGVAHGTHCAGIVAGNGYNWETYMGEDTSDGEWHHAESTGAAPEAQLSLDGCTSMFGGLTTDAQYWDTQESDGARVFSNSWGSGSGDYGSYASDIDDRLDPYAGSATMTNAGENIILFAAGNDGPGLHTISGRPQAKNGLGIGASQNLRPDEYSNADNPDYVADFSSRGGPSFSYGRIKPDLCAVGTAQISALASGEYDYNGGNVSSYITKVNEYDHDLPGTGTDEVPDYQYMQGTSMACPQAAGMTALVREYYKEVEGITNPSNPLVKATMINGADRMDSDLFKYPGYSQGWGRINLQNSLYPKAPQTNQYATGSFSTTGTWDAAADGGINLNVNSSDVPLKTTIVWLDSAGATLNRQLHMEATSPSGDVYVSNDYGADGWTLANTGASADTVNNTQRIEIKEPEKGTWTFTVYGDSIPSQADFAFVVSGDFGPQETYDVDLDTNYPTMMSLVAGGNTHLPIDVTNFGSSSDTITISDDSSADFTLSYDPGTSLSLGSTETAGLDVSITADTGVTAGVYEFEITGTSNGDATVQDTVCVSIQILADALPQKVVVANSSADETYADVLSFTDSGGTEWLFLAYHMVTPDGTQVRVKYSQLDTNGMPTGWNGPFNPMSGTPTEDPTWVKLLHIDSGSYQDRVIVYWNGITPGSNGQAYEAKMAWADSGSYSTWNGPSQIDDNYGSSDINTKRASYMLFRDDGTSGGELTYVFEHLDYTTDWSIQGIGMAYVTSSDGGQTWGSAADVPGTSSSSGYYYFFPNGVTDQNNVNWHFFYYRTTDGNSRKVVTILQDNDGFSSEIGVVGDLSNQDNHQFPVATHLNNGGTNEIYVSCIYDNFGSYYDLTTSYIQGDYSVASPPTQADFNTQNHTAATDISDAGMANTDVLGTTATGDGWAWTAYQEKETPFDSMNIDSARTNDYYSTTTVDKVTRDNYLKLNPQMSSVTVDTTSYAYLTYHSTHGTVDNVDYNIYMAVYNKDWNTQSDTVGPKSTQVSSKPNPVNLSTDSSFDLSATIDDTETGFSGIQDAEYIETTTDVTDPTTIDWSGATSMTISGTSQIETASADGIGIPGHWTAGNSYRYWVRGQDSAGNWGTSSADYVDIEVVKGASVPPSITISTPNGGEVWEQGTDHEITWSTTSGDGTITGVDLEYSSDGGSSWNTIVTGTADDGSYTWTVPNDPSTNCLVRGTVHDDQPMSGSDQSDGTFQIAIGTPPTITITDPNGGEVWDAGTDHAITWSTTSGDGTITGVDLEYSSDGGSSWNTIVTGTADDGSYTWTVPDDDSTNCLVRGTVYDDQPMSNVDSSDSTFEIVGLPPAAPGTLTVEYGGTTTTPVNDTASSATITTGTQTGTYTATQVQDNSYHELTEANTAGRRYALSMYYTVQISADTSGPYTLNIDAYRTDSEDYNVEYQVNGGGYSTFDTITAGSDTDTYLTGQLSGVAAGDTVDVRITDSTESNNEQIGTVYVDHLYINSIITSGGGTQDNLVNWTASADDGAGDNDVDHYVIYRSDSQTGPWTDSNVYDTVTADGSAEYSYTDSGAGTADSTYWWYVVRAVDTYGLNDTNTNAVPEPGASTPSTDIPLYTGGSSDGWNFVSFNLTVSDTSLTAILDDSTNGIAGNYDKVMYFDSSTGEWRSYMPGRASYYNDLSTWNHKMGLWIRMTADDTLTIEGTEPTSTDITLQPGWNMVGYPSDTATVGDVPVEVTIVGYFDGAQQYNLAYNYDPSTFNFEPGEGYWLYNSAGTSVTWTVNF